RSAVRNNNHPNNRNNNIGFRVCLSTLAAGIARSYKGFLAEANGGVFSWPRLKNRANSNGPVPCLSGTGPFFAHDEL
ncbi:MAG: hypothetical protein ACU843_17325, partial [Gammaproteobacteria bacterium]